VYGPVFNVNGLFVKTDGQKKGRPLSPPRMSAPQTCPAELLILVIVGFFNFILL